jgi:SAM-dependent methyltransferase
MLKDSFVAAFKRTGLHHLRHLIKNKYQMELDFQRKWVNVFTRNPEATLDYWNRIYGLPEIKRICGLTAESKILSVGCSPTTILQFIEANKFGVDPLADEYLKFVYPKLFHPFEDIELRRGFGEYLPYNDDFFDVVFCQNVLDHTSDPVKVVGEVFRVLRAGGFFVLIVEVFERETGRDVAHPQCFTEQKVLELTKSFAVVFNCVVTWNPNRFYVEAPDFAKTDLVLIAKK